MFSRAAEFRIKVIRIQGGQDAVIQNFGQGAWEAPT